MLTSPGMISVSSMGNSDRLGYNQTQCEGRGNNVKDQKSNHAESKKRYHFYPAY